MKTCAVCFLVLSVLFHPTTSYPQWQPDGVAVSPPSNHEFNQTMVSDGAGGAIVAWQDNRDEFYLSDIYAQRVSASGAVLWTASGVAVCTATASQCYPTITSDGAGGAIITWQDGRLYPYPNIYAQRVSATGVVQWALNGVRVAAAAKDQCYPTIVADGVGGAVITWHDYRSDNYDIYAQRVDGSGAGLWPADGVALCTAAYSQQYPTIVSDGAQGAIATWYDLRSNDNYDIYAQRVSASGVVQWTSDGVALCTATGSQYDPTIVSDGAGGAVVTWGDSRISNSNNDVYAQRVSAAGVVQWTTNGVALCTAPGQQYYPRIVSDEAGGAIVTWHDFRSGSYYDIYAQRVSAPGVAQWTTNGVALCAAANDQNDPEIVADGAGGAIVSWHDFRNSSDSDIYAQRLSASGALHWLADGVPLCMAAGSQAGPAIASDEAGGAIVTWADGRGGTSDIYAQRVTPDGLTPTRVRDTPAVSAIALTPNYPNPFSGGTALDLELRSDAVAEVQVFDAVGRRVREIEMGRVGAGSRRLSFDGLDDAGRPLPSGVYFYRVTAAGGTITRKMVITR